MTCISSGCVKCIRNWNHFRRRRWDQFQVCRYGTFLLEETDVKLLFESPNLVHSFLNIAGSVGIINL